MIDLRKYETQIREAVAKENEKDHDWKWSVKSIGKNKVRIRWGYLDYCEEKNNCFLLEMDNDLEGSGIGDWLWARTPDNGLIETWLVVDGAPNSKIGAECNIQNAIRWAIEEIAYFAHSRY